MTDIYGAGYAGESPSPRVSLRRLPCRRSSDAPRRGTYFICHACVYTHTNTYNSHATLHVRLLARALLLYLEARLCRTAVTSTASTAHTHKKPINENISTDITDIHHPTHTQTLTHTRLSRDFPLRPETGPGLFSATESACIHMCAVLFSRRIRPNWTFDSVRAAPFVCAIHKEMGNK